MNVYLFKVKYYDTVDNVERKAFSVIRAESYTKAVEELEGYYGEELLGFTVDWIDDGLIFIPEEVYDKMLNGELC
jgi:hypothetical protein